MKHRISDVKKGQVSPNKGKKFSKEWRMKLSQAKKGKPSPKRGSKLSEEQKLKISLALKGRPQTEDRKQKNRQGQYNRYLKINPNYIVATRNKRIADNGGFHTQGEWETLKAQYNWTCPCCFKKEPEVKLTKDHIISLLRGGSDNIENIQPLCILCNQKKHTQIIKY